MKCPVCSDKDLLMTERQGVEIDYCPGCRGVWLDRGELDKIMERANAESAAPAGPQQAASPAPAYSQPRDAHHDDDRDGKSKKKKGGFLGDILGGLGGD
jgi:Zn-finger nucleic acid-binding protein